MTDMGCRSDAYALMTNWASTAIYLPPSQVLAFVNLYTNNYLREGDNVEEE